MLTNVLKKVLNDNTKIRNEQCLCPCKECGNIVAGCHSIQDKGILSKLAVDNHVYTISEAIGKISINNIVPPLIFKKTSIHKASTFNGLCNEHDSKIFKPIDNEDLNLHNKQHAFLLSYRAVLKEMTDLLEQDRKNKNLSKNIPNVIIHPAYPYWISNFVKYKHKLDLMYHYGAYGSLYYKVLMLDKNAKFAASACFSTIEESTKYNGTERIILNIFPYDGKTCVLFATMQEDAKHMDIYLNQLFTASEKEQLYLLSKIVLKNCYNIAFSPDLVESWTDHKKQTILQYSLETEKTDKIGYDNIDLCLF